MESRFAGRGFVITGAASGIGLATARLLNQRGALLSLWDRNEDALTAVKTELSAAHWQIVDVTSANAVQSGMSQAAHIFGEIQGVIHAAGTLHTGLFEEMDVEVHRRTVEVNLFGTIAVAHAAIPYLKVAKGSLVLFGSSSAFYGSPEYSSYGATKAAILNLAQTLRIEQADSQIHVGVVNPLFVNTPMFNAPHGQSRLSASRSPFAHIYTPEQVADAVVRGIDRRRFMIWVGVRPRLIFWLSRYASMVSGWIMARTWRG
jgi:short-subunit dehydrogenase